MGTISKEEVKVIAQLSKIDLQGFQLDSLTTDFNQILMFVQKISEADVKDVSSIETIIEYPSLLREDVATVSLSKEDITKIAPKFEAGYFVVPKIIENND